MEQGLAKNKHYFFKEKNKNLSESDSENETADFPRFIIIDLSRRSA